MTDYLDTYYNLNSSKLVEVIDELPLWSAPFGLKLLDKIKLKKNITVLDIGFGTGFPLTELALRLGNSSIVYGIDPWKTAINRVKKKIERYGIQNIRIIEGLAEEIPLETGSVDLIVSNNGINNAGNQNKVFSECGRIMKKGGQFVLTMNLNKSMIEFYTIFEDVLKKYKMNHEVEKIHQHIDNKRKPLEEVIIQLGKNGFTILETTKDQFDYRFLDGTTMLNHYFIQLAFLESWKNILPENEVKKIFREIEKRMNDKARTKGFFSLNIPYVVVDCLKNGSE